MEYTYHAFLTKLRDEFTSVAASFAKDAKEHREGSDTEKLYLQMSNATSDKAWALDQIISDMPIDFAEKTVGAN
jgi:hypothetical protein